MIFAVQVGDHVGASRALGALLCIVCAVIAIAEIWFGGYKAWNVVPKAILLPVVLGVLVVVGLGFWLGWIMATTKEVSPAVTATPPEAESPKEEEE